MNLNQLPFLRLNFFYFHFSIGVKRLFLFTLVVLLLSGAGLVFSSVNPDFWSIQVSEVPLSEGEAIEVMVEEGNFREFPVKAEAFRHWVNFTAGPIVPGKTPVLMFMFLQLLGWSLALAVSTQITSRWSFLFFFLFALFVHFSGIGPLLFPNVPYRIPEFLFLIAYLGIAFLFQSEILKWGLVARFLTIFGTLSIPFVVLIGLKGWTAIHQVSVFSYFYLCVISIFFLYFISKEFNSLIVALVNNREKKEKRGGFLWIILLYLGLFFVQFLFLQQALRFQWIPIKLPMALLVLMIVIGSISVIFTTQNQLHQVKNIFLEHRILSFLLIGWSLISIGFLFLHFSQGDYNFRFAIERLAAIFFFAVGIGHFFYIFYNHYPLISSKVNVFYLLGYGPRLRMLAIWLAGLIGLVFAEGKDSWITIYLVTHTNENNKADQFLMQGNADQALIHYTAATNVIQASVKANYNHATLLAGSSNPEVVNSMIEKYEWASRVHDFPYAQLNAGNLLIAFNYADQAKSLWIDPAKQKNNPYILNNLAGLYADKALPDSAVLALQKALQYRPDLSAAYTNLALVYWEFGEPAAARQFLEASLDFSSPSEYALANALYFNMAHFPDLEIGPNAGGQTANQAVNYHRALNLLNQNNLEEALPILRELSDSQFSIDAMSLYAYTLFRLDSLEVGLSKAQYLTLSSEAGAQKMNELMGIAYFLEGLPRMAQAFFDESAAAGNLNAEFYSIIMDIDQGYAVEAEKRLSQFRIEHPEYWEPVARELAMLLWAYSGEVYARTEWDFSGITKNEMFRQSIYADSNQQFIPALENFRKMIMLDSNDYRPYLEMSKLYNKYKQPQAIGDLEYALTRFPGNENLSFELATAHWLQGDMESAQKILDGITSFKDRRAELEAYMYLATSDTASAIQRLDSLVVQMPLNENLLTLLTELYLIKGDIENGNRVLNEGLKYITSNADLWYYYAVCSKAWGMEEEAGFAALQAIELSRDDSRKEQIRKEFEEAISSTQNDFQ